jgi:hypothetical protein
MRDRCPAEMHGVPDARIDQVRLHWHFDDGAPIEFLI